MTDEDLIIKKISDNLRPKLLDLTKRNPLISTRFSEKSYSHIRVIDEVPQILFEKISANSMIFSPLPSLEEDPIDEKTKEFKEAVIEASSSDSIFLQETEGLDTDSEHYEELLLEATRRMKDRVRDNLELPKRQNSAHKLSLIEHAKSHNIRSSYDLPKPNELSGDGRHEDKYIQTLLLPEKLNRVLSKLCQKCNSWYQETGIGVLKVSYGFLEWGEAKNSKPLFSPLLLQPVEILKKESSKGTEFVISSSEEDCELNFTLQFKLKKDFGITLPEFDREQMSLEEYFSIVEDICPKEIQPWRVRRQVVIGVFPSARLTMYHDLDPDKWDFANHPIVGSLFGSKLLANDATMFTDEEEDFVDPYAEKSPIIIAEADSSQYRVISDALKGESLAVEGPPGSGKSQTIVNLIASALAERKKVLFVAEKSAALDVVRNRLKSMNLGEYCLPLLANNSSKANVYKLISKRIEMKKKRVAKDYKERKFELIRTKNELQYFINLLSLEYEESGYTVQQILGESLRSREIQDQIPEEIIKNSNVQNFKLKKSQLKIIKDQFERIEDLLKILRSSGDEWIFIKNGGIDPFSADDLILQAKTCASLSSQLNELRELLINHLGTEWVAGDITSFISNLSLGNDLFKNQKDLLSKIKSNLDSENVRKYATVSEEKLKLQSELSKIMDIEVSISDVEMLKNSMKRYGLSTISREVFSEYIKELEEKLASEKEAFEALEKLSLSIKGIRSISFKSLLELSELYSKTSSDVHSLYCKTSLKSDQKGLIEESSLLATRLLEKRNILKEVFDLKKCEGVDLSSKHKDLNTKGIFKIFSSKYREAKKFLSLITVKEKMSNKECEQFFNELCDFVKADRDFSEDKRIKNILGDYFDGIDTNFELINDALDLSEKVSSIDLVDFSLIKSIIQETSYEVLSRVHDYLGHINKTLSSEGNYSKLELSIKHDQKVLEDINDNRFKIESVLQGIKKPKVEIEDLDRLIKILEDLSTVRNKFDNITLDESLKNFFAQNSDISKDQINKTLDILDIYLNYSDEARESIVNAVCLEGISELERNLVEFKKLYISLMDLVAKILSKVGGDFLDLYSVKDFSQVRDKFLLLASDREGLLTRSKLRSEVNELERFHLKELGEKVVKYPDISNLSSITNALIFKSASQKLYAKFGSKLSKYSSESLNSLRKQFAELDKEYIESSRFHIRGLVDKNSNPPIGTKGPRKSEWTNMHFIENEINKKKRHSSLRKLTDRSGSALLELMPCWMMSPMAVSMYTKSGETPFDLVIIDEASQMTPEDSIGALLRGKQAVIVGDTNQLPPTNFFRQSFDENEDDTDEDVNTTNESILEMGNTVFRPARRLRWHYRSLHSSLISFSNKYIYGNDLEIFPAPDEKCNAKGVFYKYVEGLYKSGVNNIEAMEIVQAIIKEMIEFPNNSLGVVTLNQKQRERIQDLFEIEKENLYEVRAYLEKWSSKNEGLEQFFIKNLENVQGDERDTIFIGTVYGPEEKDGVVMQRFGPINGTSGKRRLNVLFTRAKKKIVTFTSMKAEQIKAQELSNQGAWLLKQWLEYSKTGILEAGKDTRSEPDSVFEEYVIKQIESMGLIAVPQVGVAGYFVDIGVRHPSYGESFIMGVECDGATYHSSRSARDRDHLRESILNKLGWKLYRIWSTSWFEDPVSEGQKLRKVINERLKELNIAST